MDNKPYIFISYAHLDSDKVYPCIEMMKQKGINTWYDEGIEAGSEWPEYIAEKVMNCTKFVLFITNAYLSSQNCKRELNFAISRKKDILSVFMEDVVLTPGMEMQLGTYQAVYLKRFESPNAFRESLCNESFFYACRLANTYSIPADVTKIRAEKTSVAPVPELEIQHEKDNTNPLAAPNQKGEKNRIIAALLAIFLGSFGIHKFYLKENKTGLLYLLFFWTYIPLALGVLDGIALFRMDEETFKEKYLC